MRSGIVLISHDRRFLERLSRTTVWLDRGITRRWTQRLRRIRGLARRGARTGRDASSHKLGRKIVMEEHWVRYGVTARRKRNSAAARPSCTRCARSGAEQRGATGSVRLEAARGATCPAGS